MKRAPLTPKQAKFAEEYLIDGNGTAAAVRSGFAAAGAHVTASRLLRNPKVSEAIREGQAETRRALKIEREHVIRDLERAYELAKQLGQPANMVAAAREIGRLCGLYEPVRHAVEVRLPPEAVGRFESMSDAQLIQILARTS